MGKAFLGLTVGCAKCHNHKYDVISQADYYSMGGFFNSDRRRERAPRGPRRARPLRWPTPIQAKAQGRRPEAHQRQVRPPIRRLWRPPASARRATVDAMPAAQRAAFLQKAINADTQSPTIRSTAGYKATSQL